MRRFSVSAVLAAILLVLSAVAAAQGSGGGQGIAVQFQVVATLPATCPTAGIVFEVPTAGTYAYYNCPTAGSAPVSFGSGGGGGVSSVQVDSNTALTGAVKLVSGNALSSSQAGQTATFNVANATTGSVGVLALAQDLAGTSSAPKVMGFDGVALKDAVPANGQAWIYNSTDGKYELGTAGASPGGTSTQVQYNNSGTLAGTAQLTVTPTGPVATSPTDAGSGLTVVGTSTASGDILDVNKAAASEFYVTAFGNAWVRGQFSAANSAFVVNPSGVVSATPAVTHTPSTYANLTALITCASGTEGTTAAVTDSTTNTWGATVAGGGTLHVFAYCDGTSWTVIGK